MPVIRNSPYVAVWRRGIPFHRVVPEPFLMYGSDVFFTGGAVFTLVAVLNVSFTAVLLPIRLVAAPVTQASANYQFFTSSPTFPIVRLLAASTISLYTSEYSGRWLPFFSICFRPVSTVSNPAWSPKIGRTLFNTWLPSFSFGLQPRKAVQTSPEMSFCERTRVSLLSLPEICQVVDFPICNEEG